MNIYNITKIEDFIKNGYSWELDKYEIKYVISGGLFWSLFSSFAMKLAYIYQIFIRVIYQVNMQLLHVILIMK